MYDEKLLVNVAQKFLAAIRPKNELAPELDIPEFSAAQSDMVPPVPA